MEPTFNTGRLRVALGSARNVVVHKNRELIGQTEWAEMSIVSDTRHYEAWLRKNCDVVNADLMHKHKRMRKNAFVFLRATYYRWARKIERWCPELMDAPDVGW